MTASKWPDARIQPFTCLPVGFAQWAGVVIVRTNIRRNGSAVNSETMRVRAIDDLLIGSEHMLDECRMFRFGNFSRAGETAEIVNSLKDDDPSDARRRQHVAVEAGEYIGAESIGQQVIAADTLIRHANVFSARRSLQTLG